MKKNLLLVFSILAILLIVVACKKEVKVEETVATTVAKTTEAAKSTIPPIAPKEADYTVGMNVLASNFGIFFDKYAVGESFSFSGSKTTITGVKRSDNTLVFKGVDDNNKAENLAAYVAIVTRLEDGYVCYQNVRRDDNELFIYCQHFDLKGRGTPLYFSTNKEVEGEKSYDLSELRNGSTGKMLVKAKKESDGSITKTIEIVDSLGITVSTNVVNVKNEGDKTEVKAKQTGIEGKVVCELMIVREGKKTKQAIKDYISNVTVTNEYESGDLDINPDTVKGSVVTKG